MLSKSTFTGIQKSNDNYDSHTFKNIEVLMDKQIYLGFVALKVPKLLLYETFYDNLQSYFGKKAIFNYNI